MISNDVLRPTWLAEKTVWLPWGDEQTVPKVIFLRNLLPSPDFAQTAQNAIHQGCGFTFNFPTPPAQEAITSSGECSQQVMGDYYPVAVWCDVETFKGGGWGACHGAAGVK